jgi:hypothetical protein
MLITKLRAEAQSLLQ